MEPKPLLYTAAYIFLAASIDCNYALLYWIITIIAIIQLLIDRGLSNS